MYLSQYDMQSQPCRPQYETFKIVSSSFFTQIWNGILSCEIQLNCKQQFHVAHSVLTAPPNNVMFKPIPLSHVTYLSAEKPWLSVIPITITTHPAMQFIGMSFSQGF